MQNTPALDPVLFSTMTTDSGHAIGIVTLNQEKTLNSLSLMMTQLISAKLEEWSKDSRIVAVIIQGAGDKAFCAGGDLHQLYSSMLNHLHDEAWSNQYAQDFFASEYRMDYFIHTYPKPVICWGKGIVMGGGMGLMMGASHRVICEYSRLAMPEVTIGLFPDVAASYFLSKLPYRLGRFLAATGMVFHAADALFLGVADFQIDTKNWSNVLSAFQQALWSNNRIENDDIITNILQRFMGEDHTNQGPLEIYAKQIAPLLFTRNIEQLIQNISTLKNHENSDIAKAVTTMLHGDPLSIGIGVVLQEHASVISLAEIFKKELIAAVHCCGNGHLQEGIRALLIDKDKSPQWPKCDNDLRQEAESIIKAPWPTSHHPLANLGMESNYV